MVYIYFILCNVADKCRLKSEQKSFDTQIILSNRGGLELIHIVVNIRNCMAWMAIVVGRNYV